MQIEDFCGNGFHNMNKTAFRGKEALGLTPPPQGASTRCLFTNFEVNKTVDFFFFTLHLVSIKSRGAPTNFMLP